MPLITKETAHIFRERATAARNRKAEARRQAESLAQSLLANPDHARTISGRVEEQSKLVHGLIERLLTGIDARGLRGAQLERLVKVQGILIAQLDKLHAQAPAVPPAKRRLIEPLTALAQSEPQEVARACQRAAEVNGHTLPELAQVEPVPPPPVDPADLLS